ncbi:MAG: phosphatidylserine decarboxylase [Victivallaceae bacterium]|nr:phosphatidylserine decarboxylase [Victivallaceae bacterium]
MTEPEKIVYVDRETGALVSETVMGDRALRFAYETALGRTMWPLLFGSGLVSALMGKYYDSKLSRRAAATLSAMPGCRADEAEKPVAEYASFNAFFTRRLKRGQRLPSSVDGAPVVPADGRITVYSDLRDDEPIPVKGALRTVAELCGAPAKKANFDLAVIRLAPVDYHRFHYPCDCVQKLPARRLGGRYHSVNPIALKRRPDLYVENAREVTRLVSDRFGEFVMIEVGAFGVGSIVQTAGAGRHACLDEKGYFKFGGSTVILVLPAGIMRFDDDLAANSAAGRETLVRCGTSLAHLI